VGLITAMAFKLAGDPTWDNDAEMKEFLKFCKEWFPEGNPTDASVMLGYVTARFDGKRWALFGDSIVADGK